MDGFDFIQTAVRFAFGAWRADRVIDIGGFSHGVSVNKNHFVVFWGMS